MDQLTGYDVNISTGPIVSFVHYSCNKIHETKWEDYITLLSLPWMDRNILKKQIKPELEDTVWTLVFIKHHR